jgi:hypothetical protein
MLSNLEKDDTAKQHPSGEFTVQEPELPGSAVIGTRTAFGPTPRVAPGTGPVAGPVRDSRHSTPHLAQSPPM